jgi:outer membrane protein assembly factor BamB
MLLAIDYQTGKIRWSRVRSGAGGGNGILTTAGGLVFTNESGRLVALDAATGKMLWHVNPGDNLSGAPMTYELDGRQFVVTPVGGWLYAWALPERSALPVDQTFGTDSLGVSRGPEFTVANRTSPAGDPHRRAPGTRQACAPTPRRGR